MTGRAPEDDFHKPPPGVPVASAASAETPAGASVAGAASPASLAAVRTSSSGQASRTAKYRGGQQSRWSNMLYVAPYLFLYVALLVYPLLAGFWLSLHKADFFGGSRFVGLQNFVRLFNDKVFLGAVGNTFYFILLTVPALALIGLGLALALNRGTRSAAFLRGVFFSSSVLSVTIVTLLWRVVFAPDGGFIANVLHSFGRPSIPFLSSEDLALPAIAITTIWWCIGLPMMLFLAALQQVPRELYEAAALDNAGRWKTLWSVTLPSIRRTFALVVIIEVVLQFQLFGQAQLMTLGGPNNASRPMVLFIYEVGFNRWDVGYAVAAGQILFGLILIAALMQYFVARRKEAF